MVCKRLKPEWWSLKTQIVRNKQLQYVTSQCTKNSVSFKLEHQPKSVQNMIAMATGWCFAAPGAHFVGEFWILGFVMCNTHLQPAISSNPGLRQGRAGKLEWWNSTSCLKSFWIFSLQDSQKCVCNSHPCWNDNGQEHTCRLPCCIFWQCFFMLSTHWSDSGVII